MEPTGFEPATTSVIGCSSTGIRRKTPKTLQSNMGRATRSTRHSHVRFPGWGFEPRQSYVVLSAFAQNLLSTALAWRPTGGETRQFGCSPTGIRHATTFQSFIHRVGATDDKIHKSGLRGYRRGLAGPHDLIVLYSCGHSPVTPSTFSTSFPPALRSSVIAGSMRPCRSRQPSGPPRWLRVQTARSW